MPKALKTLKVRKEAWAPTEIDWEDPADEVLTRLLLNCLDENPKFWFDVFDVPTKPDSSTARNRSGRKRRANIKMTAYVFTKHDVYDDEYRGNREHFLKSVGKRLVSLRDDYYKYAEELNAEKSEVAKTTKIEQITKVWKWWPMMHRFWSALPDPKPFWVRPSPPDPVELARLRELEKARKIRVEKVLEELRREDAERKAAWGWKEKTSSFDWEAAYKSQASDRRRTKACIRKWQAYVRD